MSNYTHAARTVYQPSAAHWPDELASFEAFATIQEGRRHYPGISEDQWVAVPESDIEDPTIFEDEGSRKMSDSIEQAPATKLVEVRLSALTRVEYMEVVEVPTNITQAELDDLVNARYRQVVGGEFTSDPEYWERGTCEAVLTDMPNAVPSMMAFRTAHGLHIERADAAAQTVESSGATVPKSIEPSPPLASGHTAFEATQEDVENVLRSNSLAVANTDGKSFESMANEIHGKLDFDLIEQAALAGDDLDEQTDYANDEIARQLREMGILEPLKPAYDSPSPGM